MLQQKINFQVNENASKEEIKEAYKEAALRLHPKPGSQEANANPVLNALSHLGQFLLQS